jgi:heptosyltransferase-2
LSEGNVKTPDLSLRKICLIRFSSLGDIVMATPLIRCARRAFPKAQIDMVVREDFLDLIRHNPHLDNKIGLPRGSGLRGLKELRERLNHERYDLIYDAHRSLRTLWLMPRLRADYRVYYKKHYFRRNLSLTFKLPWMRGMPRMLQRYVEPLEPFGVRYDGGGPELFVDEADRARAVAKIALPRHPGPLTVGLIPSAQWPGKRWPIGNFRKVLERLVADTRFSAMVFGGPEDTFCASLCEGLPADRVVNAQGPLTIAESAALISRCGLVVANDTGMMHVADALGVPPVLILGPTSEELGCLPFHPKSEILEQQLWCRPCSKNGEAPCIRRRRYCLERTSPENVFHALLRLAGQGSGVALS